MCVCLCVRVCDRQRDMCMCVCVGGCECVYVTENVSVCNVWYRVYDCVGKGVSVWVCLRVWEREGEREWVCVCVCVWWATIMTSSSWSSFTSSDNRFFLPSHARCVETSLKIWTCLIYLTLVTSADCWCCCCCCKVCFLVIRCLRSVVNPQQSVFISRSIICWLILFSPFEISLCL